MSKRKITVFYSWQSDMPSEIGSNFIRIALNDACARLNTEEGLGVELHVDSDTAGEPGTPPVTETILRKIATSDIFVGDVTFVATIKRRKKTPNPNVMCEYGYAVGTLSSKRILLVMNTEFGPPTKLPFDLGHLRHPAQYSVKEASPDLMRRDERKALSKRLEVNLKAIIKHILEEPAENADSSETAYRRLEQLRALSNAPKVSMTIPRAILHIVPFQQVSPLKPATVNPVKNLLVPPDYGHAVEKVDNFEWWAFSHPRRVPNVQNATSKWCTRLFRDGSLEFSMEMGFSEDDDKVILVPGHEIEDALEGMLDRLALLSEHIWLESSALVSVDLMGVHDVMLTRSRGGGAKIDQFSVHLGTAELKPFKPPLSGALNDMFDTMCLSSGWENGSGR